VHNVIVGRDAIGLENVTFLTMPGSHSAVGSVSFASPGPRAMHNASTAQEIEVITPSAKDFEFRVRMASHAECVTRDLLYLSSVGTTLHPCRSVQYKDQLILMFHLHRHPQGLLQLRPILVRKGYTVQIPPVPSLYSYPEKPRSTPFPLSPFEWHSF
jgi:hypothetical protein